MSLTDNPSADTAGDTAARALDLLHQLAGTEAEFHPGQLEAIEALVDRGQRVLVVQRTGWGKSAVYFLATRLRRDQGRGPTLLVSPLLALMRNQIDAAGRIGLKAASLNSSNMDDWETVEQEILDDGVDLLLISPERLNNPRFRAHVLPHLIDTVGLLVIDEVHCISDWGHDFRPDYRRLSRMLDQLPANVPVLGCTATANDRVVHDVEEQLGDGAVQIRGPLHRASLELEVIDLPSQAERMAWMATQVPTFDGTGIIYCLTIADAQRVAGWLRSQGINVLAYTGATEPGERLVAEDALLHNEVKALVATSALGMGYDKPDLGFVVHYQGPGSPIAYYQQVGRAGRALERARVVLLRGHEDRDIQDHFIRTAFPPRDKAEQVIALLEGAAGEPVKITEIESEVNVRRGRLEAMLKILDADGAVERVGAAWRRTEAPWTYDEERVERVTAARRAEQEAMARYGTDGTCLMRFLREQLDDPTPDDCGRCTVCLTAAGSPPEPPTFDVELVQAARTYLRGSPLAIEPRRQWPRDLAGVSGNIPADQRLQDGRALSQYGDAGWGELVRQARRRGEAYDDRLVTGAADLVRSTWKPDPPPEWVTCLPVPDGAGNLLADFATRLADRLGLPFVAAVSQVRSIDDQHLMENSAQQVRNILGAFAVTTDIPAGPVLLVDEIIDSRWTLTVVGVALRQAGAGPIHPLALAKTHGD